MTKHFNTITDQEILDAIKRSGYLLESRIIKMLDETGYWVQPNYVMKDPITGKGREIDIIVEPSPWQSPHSGSLAVRTTFIIEIVNYNSPLVFFTAKTDCDMSDMFDGIKFETSGKVNLSEGEILERYKGLKQRGSVFMQYCAFEKKSGNNSWMAYHPEDLYSSFQKFFYYISDELERWGQWTKGSHDEYNRIFFWQPIICTAGGIRIVDETGNMQEVKQLKYEYQYAERDAIGSNSALITVVTVDELLNFMNDVMAQDLAIFDELRQKIKMGHSKI